MGRIEPKEHDLMHEPAIQEDDTQPCAPFDYTSPRLLELPAAAWLEQDDSFAIRMWAAKWESFFDRMRVAADLDRPKRKSE